LTDSPTIANEEILTLRNPRVTLDYRIGAALAVRRWRCWRLAKTVARGTAKVSRRLDFLAPHVYPEACQSTPQIDRDAVIVFLVD
jgi:hypothetical protein